MHFQDNINSFFRSSFRPSNDLTSCFAYFFAFCPACRKQREGHLYLTPRQWKERGVLVMPVGYKGGKLQFEADNGLRTVPEHNPHVLKSLKGLKLHMNRRTGYDRDLGLVSIHAPVRGATNN